MSQIHIPDLSHDINIKGYVQLCIATETITFDTSACLILTKIILVNSSVNDSIHNTSSACHWVTNLDVKDFLYLPDFNAKSNEDADFDDEVGLIVHDIKKYNDGLKDVEEDRTNRQTLERLTVAPELNICTKETTNITNN